ncbi:MAG: hypothetical protein CVU09_12965 [Bacteroidetes bacterium HGW-Bacteroidetes-4]|jgi:ABC-type antimicrobial peptide transport system permease subunit|nr:MAG: hypothetical protein CVU09_12965 [Bacteroidetes bacterium HGW-Bacteroidetes-4]
MKKNKVLLLALLGAIIGVAVVRMFFLNSIQIMGWKLFWNNLASLNFDMFENVFESATFGKSVLGFLIGGFLGILSSKKL